MPPRGPGRRRPRLLPAVRPRPGAHRPRRSRRAQPPSTRTMHALGSSRTPASCRARPSANPTASPRRRLRRRRPAGEGRQPSPRPPRRFGGRRRPVPVMGRPGAGSSPGRRRRSAGRRPSAARPGRSRRRTGARRWPGTPSGRAAGSAAACRPAAHRPAGRGELPQRSRGLGVGPDALCQPPQLQVHRGGDVVRQPAKDAAPPRRRWRPPAAAARRGRAGRNRWRRPGMIRGTSGATSVARQLLGPVEPVVRVAGRAGRAGRAVPYVRGGTRRPRRSASTRRSRRWVAAGLTTACSTCAGTPYAADTRSTSAREGTPRALGEGQVGFHQQAPQDHRGPGLHVVEHPRHQGTSHPAAEQRGHVDEQSLAGVGVHRRPGAAVGRRACRAGRATEEPGAGRTPDPSA